MQVDVTVNEADQSAIIAILPTGRVVSRPGVFSPNEVRVLDEESTWVIDRVSLAFKRVIALGGTVATEPGQCRVKPAPAKRAF